MIKPMKRKKQASKQSGVPKGRIVREQLEKARRRRQGAFIHEARWFSSRCARSLDAQGIFPVLKGIADRGFLVAFSNADDKHHQWAAQLAAGVTEPLLNRKGFQVYRRNKRESIPLLCPPER